MLPSSPAPHPPDSSTSLSKRARRGRRNPLSSLIEIGETSVGRGVFAKRRLAGGLVVGEIRGEVMETHPADPQYCMELASGRLLEPAAPFRFLNHCCDPNCELFYWFDEEATLQEDRLWLQTIRPIEAGEELSIDYCWPADAAIECRCGAANCRGWIVDPAELHLVTNPPNDAAGAASPPSPPSS